MGIPGGEGVGGEPASVSPDWTEVTTSKGLSHCKVSGVHEGEKTVVCKYQLPRSKEMLAAGGFEQLRNAMVGTRGRPGRGLPLSTTAPHSPGQLPPCPQVFCCFIIKQRGDHMVLAPQYSLSAGRFLESEHKLSKQHHMQFGPRSVASAPGNLGHASSHPSEAVRPKSLTEPKATPPRPQPPETHHLCQCLG